MSLKLLKKMYYEMQYCILMNMKIFFLTQDNQINVQFCINSFMEVKKERLVLF